MPVNFRVDDTARKTFVVATGLAWKGTFRFDASSRIMTFDGSWNGPYPLLYDDGSWTDGGHEPQGSTPHDNMWGVTVWVSNAATRSFEYGAVVGYAPPNSGTWIWNSPSGLNGVFTVSAGATVAVDAPGLVIP